MLQIIGQLPFTIPLPSISVQSILCVPLLMMIMFNITRALCHGAVINVNRSVDCDSLVGNNSSCVPSTFSINYRTTGLTIVAMLLSSVIICTALGNLLVGLALIRFRALRSVSNLLIGNLALSDFLSSGTWRCPTSCWQSLCYRCPPSTSVSDIGSSDPRPVISG